MINRIYVCVFGFLKISLHFSIYTSELKINDPNTLKYLEMTARKSQTKSAEGAFKQMSTSRVSRDNPTGKNEMAERVKRRRRRNEGGKEEKEE